MPTAPVPALRLYRNFPSALTAISIFDEPVGLIARIVPGIGVSVPPLPIANPDMDPEPAFETYTKRPSGVTTFQQLAEPNVGTLLLIGTSVPLLCTEYEEIADKFGPPGPVSETTATSLRVKPALNAPGPTLFVMVACDREPSLSTLNTSRLFVAFSVTIKNCASGLNATEPDATVLPLRKRKEFGIRTSLPLLKLNPTTLLLPAVFNTYTRDPLWATELGSLPSVATRSVNSS